MQEIQKNKGGRPTKLVMNETMERVLQEYCEGKTLGEICKESWAPSLHTFRKWRLENPELQEKWLIAKELKAEALFERALEQANALMTGDKEPSANLIRASQVSIDTLKWAASRLNPREYGERIATNPVVPIQVFTSLNIGQLGRPSPGEASIYDIEARPVTVIEVDPEKPHKEKKLRLKRGMSESSDT